MTLAPTAAWPRCRTAVVRAEGPHWQLGTHGGVQRAQPRSLRAAVILPHGPHPFERLKRVDNPTTYIDAPNVPRMPKRTDMFARGQFGDMGPKVQNADERRASRGQIRALCRAAPPAGRVHSVAGRRRQSQTLTRHTTPPAMPPTSRPQAIFWAQMPRACRPVPTGPGTATTPPAHPITPPHDQALSMIIDQGFETMEGVIR